MANLRPWRKVKLQVFVTDKWNDQLECDQPDGALAQVGGHGAWDKDQAMQVSVTYLFYLFMIDYLPRSTREDSSSNLFKKTKEARERFSFSRLLPPQQIQL